MRAADAVRKFFSCVTMYQSLMPLSRGAFVAWMPWPAAP